MKEKKETEIKIPKREKKDAFEMNKAIVEEKHARVIFHSKGKREKKYFDSLL